MTTFVTALFVGIYRQGYRNGCQGKEYEMQRTLIVRGAPGKEYGTTVADAINSVLKKNPESKLTNAIVLVFLEAFVRENYDLTSKGIIQSL